MLGEETSRLYVVFPFVLGVLEPFVVEVLKS
jgi:hypothetical protein